MSITNQISEAYDLITGDQDPEGVHIRIIRNEGEDEEEVGIIEFLDDETVYIERYGEEISDVQEVSDMTAQEFEQFVRNVLSL